MIEHFHRWHNLYGFVQTSAHRPVWVTADCRSGGYFDGRRNDQSLEVSWQPSPH